MNVYLSRCKSVDKIYTHMLLASLPIKKMWVECIYETWRDLFSVEDADAEEKLLWLSEVKSLPW